MLPWKQCRSSWVRKPFGFLICAWSEVFTVSLIEIDRVQQIQTIYDCCDPPDYPSSGSVNDNPPHCQMKSPLANLTSVMILIQNHNPKVNQTLWLMIILDKVMLVSSIRWHYLMMWDQGVCLVCDYSASILLMKMKRILKVHIRLLNSILLLDCAWPLLLWQCMFHVSDAGMAVLVLFMHHLFCLLSSLTSSQYLSSLSKPCPITLHSVCKLLGLLDD